MAIASKKFLQNTNVPTNKIQTFVINQFNGGLNNVTELNGSECVDVLNMKFSEGIYMEKRTGITDSKMVVGASLDIVFVDKFRPYVGDSVVLVASNSAIYIRNKDKTLTVLSAISGKPRGLNFYGKYFFVDGKDMFVYDGVTCKKVVNPPSGFVPKPKPALKGEWKSDATTSWYEPCAYEIEDTSLGANIIPKNPTLIESRKNRLYISGCSDNPNNIYISDLENGFYFATLLPIQPTPNGEKVVGLKLFQDTLIIAREESFYALYGSSNRAGSTDPFTIRQITTHAGCASDDSMAIMNNFLVYLGTDGVVYRMITPLTDVRQLTTDILSKKINLTYNPLNINRSDYSSAIGLFNNGEYFLKVGDKILVYNYIHQAWTVYSGINTKYMFVMDYVKYYAGSDGRIYRDKVYDANIDVTTPEDKRNETLTAYSDGDGNNRKAINAFYRTKQMDFGSPSYYKFFRDVYVTAKVFKFLKSTTDITFELDYADVTGRFSSKMSMSIFGISEFGDLFVNKSIVDSLPSRLGRRARTISLKFHNSNRDEPMRVVEFNGDYTIRGRR